MSVRISPNLPANVVEIGNEISQAKINEINAGTLALQTYVTSRGYLTDAPSNGSEYVRKNGAWSVATGGGGGGSVAWGSITGTITSQTDLTSYVTGLGYIGDAPSDSFSYVRNSGAWTQFTGITEAPLDGASYARYMGAWVDVSTTIAGKADTIGATEISVSGSGGTARLGVSGSGSGAISVTDLAGTNTTTLVPTGITFPDSTTQTTAYTGGSSYSNDQIKADFIVNNLQYWAGYYGMFNFPAMPMFITNLGVGMWGIWDNNTSTGIAFSYGYASGNQMALYFGGSLSSGNLSVYINSTYSSYSV